MMLTLSPQLEQRFRDLAIRMEVADRNTVLLRQVPTNPMWFSQPHTALLVKRPQAGMPYVVCVSSELQYTGRDPEIAQVFRGGIPQNGWRTLLMTLPQSLDLAAAVDEGLAVIGFDGAEPRLPVGRDGKRPSSEAASPEGNGSLIDRFGVDLVQRWPDGAKAQTVGRDDEVLDVLSSVLSERERLLPVIVGPSGVGKTNLLRAVSARVQETFPERQVLVINPSELVVGVTFGGEFENIFSRMLQEAECRPELILAIEHFELMLVSRIPRLLAEALDRGRLRLIGTLLPQFANRLRAPLARRLRLVHLPELDWLAIRTILSYEAESLTASRGLPIEPALVEVCRKAAAELPGVSPSKEIALLETAVVRAQLTGADHLSADDILHVVHRMGDANRETPF